MKRRIKHTLFTILLLVALLFVIEHAVLVVITRSIIRYVVSMDTNMKRVILNPICGCITVSGLKIFNPPNFDEKILADIPLIKIDFKARTLFEEGNFFDKILLHIKEINVIKNKEGLTNISQMKAFTPKDKPKENGPFLAEKYIVEIEKAKKIDYSQGKEPVIKEVELNINEEYKNVKKPESILKAIGFKLYFNGKFQDLGINVQNIQKELVKLAEENEKLRAEFDKITKERMEAVKEAIQEKVEDIKAKASEVKETMINRGE
jgi:hypothetical protein